MKEEYGLHPKYETYVVSSDRLKRIFDDMLEKETGVAFETHLAADDEEFGMYGLAQDGGDAPPNLPRWFEPHMEHDNFEYLLSELMGTKKFGDCYAFTDRGVEKWMISIPYGLRGMLG